MPRVDLALDPTRTGREAAVLEKNLKKLIVGQDEAIQQIVNVSHALLSQEVLNQHFTDTTQVSFVLFDEIEKDSGRIPLWLPRSGACQIRARFHPRGHPAAAR
jgi:hypothetical protein